MTISRAARIPRYRHGRETTPGCLVDPPPGLDAEERGWDGLLLGGATCACP
jgi:hypothetical protein